MTKPSYILFIVMLFFSAQVAHSQRAIAFEGVENARDMGSLAMQNGQTVRTGMLVRSGNLTKATDSDVAVLKVMSGAGEVAEIYTFKGTKLRHIKIETGYKYY